MKLQSKRHNTLHTVLSIAILIVILSSASSLAGFPQKNLGYNHIVTKIISTTETLDKQYVTGSRTYHNILAERLQSHPEIKQTTSNHNSITVKFNDGYQLVIIDTKIPEKNHDINTPLTLLSTNPDSAAVLLNPFAWIYGNRQCRIISRILSSNTICATYVENDEVDLRYIEHNLSSAILYLNTHAGYWDINGSLRTESIVIATGELWTNITPMKYPFEYTNKLIVEGIVGKTSYIAFTPALIEQYYNDSAFLDSFIYMATCHGIYDESMASVFLEKNASVYVSWTRDTVFWTNNLASIWTFRLLSLGLPIQNICEHIGSGGFYNWLFESELRYIGDGDFRL